MKGDPEESERLIREAERHEAAELRHRMKGKVWFQQGDHFTADRELEPANEESDAAARARITAVGRARQVLAQQQGADVRSFGGRRLGLVREDEEEYARKVERERRLLELARRAARKDG